MKNLKKMKEDESSNLNDTRYNLKNKIIVTSITRLNTNQPMQQNPLFSLALSKSNGKKVSLFLN